MITFVMGMGPRWYVMCVCVCVCVCMYIYIYIYLFTYIILKWYVINDIIELFVA